MKEKKEKKEKKKSRFSKDKWGLRGSNLVKDFGQ